MTNIETFGEIIKRYRELKNYSLRDLAGKINVAPSFLSMMENNKNDGTAKEETIKKLAFVLGIDPINLLNLAGKIPAEQVEVMQNDALTFFRKDLKKRIRDDETKIL